MDEAPAASGGTAELEQLAAELNGQQYAVTLVTAAGRRPHLAVTNRRALQLTENIYAGAADDGAWWFYWGWAERIAPVADLAAAAAAIAKVLRVVDPGR